MRRRYMATPNLMEAAAILSHAYQRTPMAERLGNLNVLLTDSMQIRTLKGSLIARQHHRYLSGNAIVLWNALSLEEILYETDDISSADLNRILPTMVRHINFVGRFDLDFTRKPPFELKQVIG